MLVLAVSQLTNLRLKAQQYHDELEKREGSSRPFLLSTQESLDRSDRSDRRARARDWSRSSSARRGLAKVRRENQGRRETEGEGERK